MDMTEMEKLIAANTGKMFNAYIMNKTDKLSKDYLRKWGNIKSKYSY